MKTNLSFRKMGSLFKIGDNLKSRRKGAADAFGSARKLLVELFVPKNLRVNHITKEEAKSHNISYTEVRRLRFGYRQKKIKIEQ